MVHEIGGVEGTPAVPRIVGAVGRAPEELDGKIVHRLPVLVGDTRVEGRVPVEDRVHIIEQLRVDH